MYLKAIYLYLYLSLSICIIYISDGIPEKIKSQGTENLSNEIIAESIPKSHIHVQEVYLKINSKWVEDLIADQKL